MLIFLKRSTFSAIFEPCKLAMFFTIDLYQAYLIHRVNPQSEVLNTFTFPPEATVQLVDITQ